MEYKNFKAKKEVISKISTIIYIFGKYGSCETEYVFSPDFQDVKLPKMRMRLYEWTNLNKVSIN
jgi:hypothetical protein